jgi:hypothetical protein
VEFYACMSSWCGQEWRYHYLLRHGSTELMIMMNSRDKRGDVIRLLDIQKLSFSRALIVQYDSRNAKTFREISLPPKFDKFLPDSTATNSSRQ